MKNLVNCCFWQESCPDTYLPYPQESAGSPDLPNSGRLIELEYASMEDRKLRSQLRNVSALELQVRHFPLRALC